MRRPTLLLATKVLVCFLRGPLTNLDTPPVTSDIRSILVRPPSFQCSNRLSKSSDDVIIHGSRPRSRHCVVELEPAWSRVGSGNVDVRGGSRPDGDRAGQRNAQLYARAREGLVEEVGPAAEIYGLGALLYCLVTSRPPFQTASRTEPMSQVLEREPVPPRQLTPGEATATRPSSPVRAGALTTCRRAHASHTSHRSRVHARVCRDQD